jgi:hypothetical protein
MIRTAAAAAARRRRIMHISLLCQMMYLERYSSI